MIKIPEEEVYVIEDEELKEPLVIVIGEPEEETTGYGIPPKSEMH
jgi:hypothetical protein